MSPQGTFRPRYARCLSVAARLYTECVSTAQTVGVYSPVGVESAMHISECGRRVIVGLLPLFETPPGVIEERKSGQECIAFERVLRRMGR